MPAHAAPWYKLPLLRRFAAAAALAGACLCLVMPRAAARGAESDAEVRALWVTRASLTTPAAIDALVASARTSGFNTLLVQVRGRGDAYFTGGLEPRADALAGQRPEFDPLERVLDQARPHGLRVHAWINVNLVASSGELPSSRTHVIYRHPDWLMVPRNLSYHLARVGSRSPEFLGRLTRWTRTNDRVEGLFLSPILPEAASYTVAVVEDLVRRYPVDGVHFDYIRYPGPEFDYSLGALRAFHADLLPELPPAERTRFDARSIADLTALTDLYPERWAGFRRSRLNALLLRLRTAVKAQRPDAVLSAAVMPDPDVAATERFQDWRFWAEQRWVDVICPMAYTADVLTFAAQIARAREVVSPQGVWAGIGAWRLSPGRTIENIHAARRAGAHGIVLFSYDSLVQPPRGADNLASIGRAAFTP
ncbi:MAG TPA: family 10 glycosylhydrolase [Vicinamibacterales bacterium]